LWLLTTMVMVEKVVTVVRRYGGDSEVVVRR
jgi:hypothetical protein